MFSSFTGMLSKLKDNKLINNITQNITQNYTKIKEQVLGSYQIIQILPQIYHIPFPQSENVGELEKHIGKSDFQIWNVGEYFYDQQTQKKLLSSPQQGAIQHLCYQLYANLPFYELLMALDSMKSFIECKKTNKIYVHCQENRMRSAVFLVCFIYKHKLLKVADISEAILIVNKALKVKLQDQATSQYQSAHILFKNLVNFLDNSLSINQNCLNLVKIIFNNPPALLINEQKPIQLSQGIKVSIQIRCGQKKLAKAKYDGSEIQGDIFSIDFEAGKMVLSDQFLIIVKYIYNNSIYNILRVQLNTNFIYQGFTRVYQQSIDLSSFGITAENSLFFFDFLFLENQAKSKLSSIAKIYAQKQEIINKREKDEALQKKEKIVKESKEIAQKEAFQEAIAELHRDTSNEPNESNLPEESEALQKQIAQKLANSIKQIDLDQDPAEQQDLQDYLSKLQSQA